MKILAPVTDSFLNEIEKISTEVFWNYDENPDPHGPPDKNQKGSLGVIFQDMAKIKTPNEPFDRVKKRIMDKTAAVINDYHIKPRQNEKDIRTYKQNIPVETNDFWKRDKSIPGPNDQPSDTINRSSIFAFN